MKTEVYLLLGTNLGDRLSNLSIARQHISRLAGEIITESSVYKTSAWGNTQQPEFFNQVIKISTSLMPEAALAVILGIEQNMGRIRNEKWGTRIIDIDILLWEDQIIKKDTLSIPHPGIPFRKFTLIPLAEITPQFIHPECNKSISKLLEECNDNLAVEKV